MQDQERPTSGPETGTTPLKALPAWQALEAHHARIKGVHMRDLFASDPDRFNKYSIKFNDLLFDYSKNRCTEETLDLLCQLARQSQLKQWIEDTFNGERINNTEQRAVLHVALRNRSNRPIEVDGRDVMPEVNRVLERVERFTDQVRQEQWRGYSGRPISRIVNIGIGGSDLGPYMASTALKPYWKPGMQAYFVSNVDGTHIAETLRQVDPETTLFIIASKTFTTKETMANANSAREWFLQQTGGDESNIRHHFVAVSTNSQAVAAFGIDTENMFEFWDWVGGRYSLWSAIGLPIALCVGMDRFYQMLEGAHEMDCHFFDTDFRQNIPVIMALLGVWYRNFYGASTHAVLPYDHSLRLLPSYLQQGDMESNGKRITRDGETVDYPTGPVIWGAPGTNGQHAFFQLIHQGTELIPADFIIPALSHNPVGQHHRVLVANCIAQTEALMTGRTREASRRALAGSGQAGERLELLAAHKEFPGNQPTNTLVMDQLTPQSLGTLIAAYEHKIFVQGVIWQINSFDQMGVELGKQLADVVEGELAGDLPAGGHDSSTNGLINHCRSRSL